MVYHWCVLYCAGLGVWPAVWTVLKSNMLDTCSSPSGKVHSFKPSLRAHSEGIRMFPLFLDVFMMLQKVTTCPSLCMEHLRPFFMKFSIGSSPGLAEKVWLNGYRTHTSRMKMYVDVRLLWILKLPWWPLLWLLVFYGCCSFATAVALVGVWLVGDGDRWCSRPHWQNPRSSKVEL